MESKDVIAQRLFQAPYNRLSAFAQDRVDGLYNALQTRTSIQEENDAILGATLEERVDFLARRVANLEMEYEEIWIENSQLKEELATLQSEINLRSS